MPVEIHDTCEFYYWEPDYAELFGSADRREETQARARLHFPLGANASSYIQVDAEAGVFTVECPFGGVGEYRVGEWEEWFHRDSDGNIKTNVGGWRTYTGPVSLDDLSPTTLRYYNFIMARCGQKRVVR